MFKDKQTNTQAHTQAHAQTQEQPARARVERKPDIPKKSVSIPRKGGELSGLVKSLQEQNPDYTINLVTDVGRHKVDFESILVELPGISAMLMVVNEADSISKHASGKGLIPSDTLDSIYSVAVKAVTDVPPEDIISFITFDEDIEARAVELIIYVGEKYNGDVSPTVVVDKKQELHTEIKYCNDRKVSPITGTPLTTEFISTTEVLDKNDPYSRNRRTGMSSEITGYFRPIPTNKEVKTVNSQGLQTITETIRIETDLTINNIATSSPTINDLLIGVYSLIASNKSFSSIWFSKLMDKPEEVAPLEVLTTDEKLPLLTSLQPHEIIERLKNIIVNETNISVDLSLSTMPEIYDILTGIISGDEDSYNAFHQSFMDTFGAKIPEGMPIVLMEKNEYPVGFIPANGINLPITDITPTKVMNDGEVDLGLNLFANQISISTDPMRNLSPFECWLGTISQMGFVGKLVENGLHITFTPEFLKHIIACTAQIQVTVNGEVLEEPITNISTQSYLSKQSLDLGALTTGMYVSSKNTGSIVYPKPHNLYQTLG